jgi:hypothetical protein
MVVDAVLCAAAIAASLALAPVPIGPGSRFAPPPRWPLAGTAIFSGFATQLEGRERIHLELFAHRRVIVVPGGIGVPGTRTMRYGRVTATLGHAPAWTLSGGGVIELGRRDMTLGDVFAVWGQPLTPSRLLSFEGPLHTFVNGRIYRADVRSLALHDRDQVVLELGGCVPPHRRFTFRPAQ